MGLENNGSRARAAGAYHRRFPPVDPGMAPRDSLDRSAMASQLGLGGLVVFVVAMAYRRFRDEHQLPSPKAATMPSRRSVELTRGGTPAHILEHIARIGDPDYICLSIAENKLTVREKKWGNQKFRCLKSIRKHKIYLDSIL